MYKPGTKNVEWVISIQLSSDAFGVLYDLRPGQAKAAVLKRLGKPTEKSDKQFVYRDAEVPGNCAKIEIKDGYVAAIEWEFYYD